jgi:hypothetical protein
MAEVHIDQATLDSVKGKVVVLAGKYSTLPHRATLTRIKAARKVSVRQQ